MGSVPQGPRLRLKSLASHGTLKPPMIPSLALPQHSLAHVKMQKWTRELWPKRLPVLSPHSSIFKPWMLPVRHFSNPVGASSSMQRTRQSGFLPSIPGDQTLVPPSHAYERVIKTGTSARRSLFERIANSKIIFHASQIVAQAQTTQSTPPKKKQTTNPTTQPNPNSAVKLVL